MVCPTEEILLCCEVWGVAIDWGKIKAKVFLEWKLGCGDLVLSLIGVPANRVLCFPSKAMDVERLVMNGPIDFERIILKRWHSMPDGVPVSWLMEDRWVKVWGLPSHLWNLECFRCIGEKCGVVTRLMGIDCVLAIELEMPYLVVFSDDFGGGVSQG